LNNRLWYGTNPVRLVLDMNLRLPQHLRLFDGSQRTIIFNKIRHDESDSIHYYKINEGQQIPQQIATAAYNLNLQSILVEGGQMLLQSFIDAGLWDEARVIENRSLLIEDGVGAPVLRHQTLHHAETHGDDDVRIYLNTLQQHLPLNALNQP